jgi:hypothetical protein
MWRALFLAAGIYCCLLGVKAIAIEKAVLKTDVAASVQNNSALGISRSATTGRVEVSPPEWAPWSLISVGFVVILYSFSIPKRVRG